MDAVMITPKIYQVSLKIVNIFLICIDDILVLIDTGPADSKPFIFNAVKKIGYQPADIKHIIITHSHHDHSGSLADILKDVNATVYMHPNDAVLVRRGIAYRFGSKILKQFFDTITISLRVKLPFINIKPVRQITEVNDGDCIPDCGGLCVIYAPGHSAGQIALLYETDNGIMLVADAAENHGKLILARQYQDKDQSMATIKKIAGFDFNIALFSHGEPILNHASEIFKTVFVLN